MVRRTVGGVVAAVVVLSWSVAAWAHVTVQPGEAPKGSFSEISFRVPNERDDASTTELRVQLPADHPIAFVSLKPLEGWTATAKTEQLDEPIEGEGEDITEAVTEITWTGGAVEPGQYQDFSISAGSAPRRRRRARVQGHPDLLGRRGGRVDRGGRHRPRPQAHIALPCSSMSQLLRVQCFNVSRDGFGAGEGQSLEQPFGHARRLTCSRGPAPPRAG